MEVVKKRKMRQGIGLHYQAQVNTHQAPDLGEVRKLTQRNNMTNVIRLIQDIYSNSCKTGNKKGPLLK